MPREHCLVPRPAPLQLCAGAGVSGECPLAAGWCNQFPARCECRHTSRSAPTSRRVRVLFPGIATSTFCRLALRRQRSQPVQTVPLCDRQRFHIAPSSRQRAGRVPHPAQTQTHPSRIGRLDRVFDGLLRTLSTGFAKMISDLLQVRPKVRRVQFLQGLRNPKMQLQTGCRRDSVVNYQPR